MQIDTKRFNRIKSDFVAGKGSPAELGRIYGLETDEVIDLLKEHHVLASKVDLVGLPPGFQRFSKAVRHSGEIELLGRKGLSVKEISRQVGVAPRSVRELLRSLGFSVRTSRKPEPKQMELISGLYDADAYQQDAARTINPDLGPEALKQHALLGMNSEAGELAGLYQKVFQGHTLDADHVKKELGDLLWFVAEFCTGYGWSLDEVMRLNIEKLKARYPEGFDTEHSLHRKDGDV